MRKIRRILGILGLAVILALGISLWKDKQVLREDLIRLHVVGASDSEHDQRVKLQVKDAVISYLQETVEYSADVQIAEENIRNLLPELEAVANATLAEAGFSQSATVCLDMEEFPQRQYETFSLPAGVYRSLRVTIGQGQGKNWWCVVFPTLCLPATSQGFEDTAVSAGFSDTLTDTLQKKTPGYEIRFFFLDCLGWLENLFYSG